MAQYEKRLMDDKRRIRERVCRVGNHVEAAVSAAVRGMLAGDRAACYRIILGDLPINREIRSIDRQCHAFVARHLPSAGHLRFVSTVLRMNVALERIGDYAVTIAREAVQLTTPPEGPARDLSGISEQCCRMLRQAMRAFAESDAELARETKPLAREIERAHDGAFRKLSEGGSSRPLRDLFALLGTFNVLERVSDQAKNICEETLFEVLGETKPPKVYRVLFLDARDTLIGPLAVAIARKAFPDSGRFDSAGWSPGSELAAELEPLAADLGLDFTDLQPTKLTTDVDELARYHVIVSVAPDASKHLAGVPFHTALLEWDLPKLAETEGAMSTRISEVCRHLSTEIRDLMVTLRGEEAS